MDLQPEYAADYPRKRTAIACEICRARRSKCDALKPACSKCVELEVECIYRKPNLWDREPVTVAAAAALGKVDGRLDQIHESITALSEQLNCLAKSRRNSPVRSPGFGVSPPPNLASFDLNGKAYQALAVPSSYGSLSAAKPHSHRMPNLMSFVAPASLGSFSYDSTQNFFAEEIEKGNALFDFINEALLNGVQADFSPQTCWRLQHAFVNQFLPWMPVFDGETCLHHFQVSSATNFSDNSYSSCLTLLSFAIGAMSGDEYFYHEDPRELPGFEYLALGYRILKTMKYPLGDTLHLQCRSLFAVYLDLAILPVQSWHEINQISREYMFLTKTNWISHGVSDAELRARTFWVAYVVENELEVCLELPSSGIRTLQETVTLPTSAVEEEGLYYFLALISLRKMLAEVIETIGFKSGHSIYVPIVAVELRNQMLSWHKHLPASLRFPLDSSTLFDLRKACLRSQLLCLSSVIYWPFVIRHIESLEFSHKEPDKDPVEFAAVHEKAKECIDSCVLYLKASEGLMMQKTLATHYNLRSFYAILMVLIIAYQPIYQSSPPPDIIIVTKRSLVILSTWNQVPFMREPLNRIHCFAQEAGWYHISSTEPLI